MEHSTRSTTALLAAVQGTLLVVFLTCTSTPQTDMDTLDLTMPQYNMFRDVMVMLLLGFGFLMTFLKQYGLSAVGLTMLITVLTIQLNLVIEPLIRFIYKGKDAVDFPLPLGIANLIDGEFAAATALISFGVLIGRATPLQLLTMILSQAVFYAVNKVVIVYGALAAEDVGGTITIHAFGAYFGLAMSRAFRAPKPWSLCNSQSTAVSDVLSLLGTALLWVFWPSFVGATETASAANRNHCVLHTVLALLGSTAATFLTSHALVGKFDPFHIANATLAGGVAAGASARLDMTMGGALVLGIVAGTVSVLGFVHVTPFLERRLSIHDTCGVHNLHGMPSIVGGLASAIFVMLHSSADFLVEGRTSAQQAGYQILAVVCTVVFASVTGWITGCIMVAADENALAEYDDAAWWKSDYLIGDAVYPDAAAVDKSHHSHGSILPVLTDQP